MHHSWRTLRLQYDFSAEDLKQIQPDKSEWVKRGQLTLHDCQDMRVFPINPFVDLGADIGEVWSMHWSTDMLASMGVTFTQMRERGLSAQVMHAFRLPLSAWQQLGLAAQHVPTLSDSEIQLVFSLKRDELDLILTPHGTQSTGIDI